MLSEDKEFLIEFNAGGISPQALHSITLQTIKRSHGLVFRRLYFKQRLKSAIFLMCRVRLSTSTEPTLTREARKTLLHDGGLSTKCHYYFICIFLLCTYTIFEQIAAPPCHPPPPPSKPRHEQTPLSYQQQLLHARAPLPESKHFFWSLTSQNENSKNCTALS